MTIPLWLLGIHFIADFLLQTDWMAINKSKRWDALTIHVTVYSLAFALLLGPLFGLITFVTHFVTDTVTSRITRRLFPWSPSVSDARVYIDYEGDPSGLGLQRSRHWFFCAIGLDQLIHYATLALTYDYLVL